MRTNSLIGTPRPLRISTIDHVAVNVRDLDMSTDFYTAMFGFTRVRRTPFRQVLRHGSLEFHLFQAPDPTATKPHNWQHLGLQHLAFAVGQAELEWATSTLAQMTEHVEGPVEDEDGRALYIRDPDGNVIELRQER